MTVLLIQDFICSIILNVTIRHKFGHRLHLYKLWSNACQRLVLYRSPIAIWTSVYQCKLRQSKFYKKHDWSLWCNKTVTFPTNIPDKKTFIMTCRTILSDDWNIQLNASHDSHNTMNTYDSVRLSILLVGIVQGCAPVQS